MKKYVYLGRMMKLKEKEEKEVGLKLNLRSYNLICDATA